ncbi:hypothetical protein DL98DRAFT_470747 [Cadophora sp. DSE1049]|nr:hypothetical protein DL98DRAFT_470747 [Cadophora sp. DSE1049]
MAALVSAAAKFMLVFFAPVPALEACKTAIFAAGAGYYPEGKYTECCWTILGNGQFRPRDAANPHTGRVGKLEHTKKARVEVICFSEDIARKAVAALKAAHPYEEPSYGVYKLEDF